MSLRLNFAKAKLCFRISIPSHQNKKHPSGWFRYRQAHACGKNSFLPPRSDTSARLVVSLAQRPKNSHLGSFCLSYRHRHGLSNPVQCLRQNKKHTDWCAFCFGGRRGIRTHVGVNPNGFQDRLVMTASIAFRICYLLFRVNNYFYFSIGDASLCPVAVPDSVFARNLLANRRPQPLLIARLLCHRQRSQTSPLR